MKFFRNLIIIGLLGGGFLIARGYRVVGIDGLRLSPRSATGGVVDDLKAMVGSSLGSYGDPSYDSIEPGSLEFPRNVMRTVSRTRAPTPTIRIATFNLHRFSREKAENTNTMDFFARLIRQFDVVALQEIDASRRDLLPKIVEHLNRSGADFDFIAGPKVGPPGYEQRLAFVFDRRRVEVDRKQTYTMADPANLVAYEPLVAWFRTSGVPKASAWTFSLANVYIDPDHPEQEREVLPTLYKAISIDGRGEDDVILAGCFFASDDELRSHVPPGVAFALAATPTDVYARHQTSNIILDNSRTSEFNGNSGAIDFLRKYNLTIAEAEAISDHLPVWAEFSVIEAQETL